MKQNILKLFSLFCVLVLTGTGTIGCGSDKEPAEEETVFEPSLDTEKTVELGIAGYMGNFEALDQVVNDFNEYYPNVTISYEQNSQAGAAEYLSNADYNDIFMTSEASVRSADQPDTYVLDWCEDLSQESFGIDVSAIDPELIKACTIDGKLVRLPLTKLMCGIVVNEDLLKNNGIEIPEAYDEFVEACKVLKDKGYTPVQASKYHAYSDLMLPMGMAIIGNDKDAKAKAMAGDTSYAAALQPVFEKLKTLIDAGYVDYVVNESYPDDNYDQAILKFFEGDVPFWVATTESFSGMKKRESKSESFAANPFSYKFINAPMGDKGSYVYAEPWYGFSLNKNSKNKEYAAEFLRFLAGTDELNKLAEVKGMPSATVNSTDETFSDALNPKKIEASYIYNGDLANGVTGSIANTCNQMGAGSIKSVDEAISTIENQ